MLDVGDIVRLLQRLKLEARDVHDEYTEYPAGDTDGIAESGWCTAGPDTLLVMPLPYLRTRYIQTHLEPYSHQIKPK